MIKGIIFDLDNCILDTRTLGEHAIEPVLKVLQESNLSKEQQERIEEALWTSSLIDVAELFNIPQEIVEAMRKAYSQLDVPNGISSYGDEDCIKELPTINILVTTGYKKFQTQKIDQLGIRELFTEIIIDEVDNPEKRKGKKVIFQEMLLKYRWKKEEVFVVGDNPDSELKAGKEIGLKTVQTLRKGIEKWDVADYHVKSLSELIDIVKAG